MLFTQLFSSLRAGSMRRGLNAHSSPAGHNHRDYLYIRECTHMSELPTAPLCSFLLYVTWGNRGRTVTFSFSVMLIALSPCLGGSPHPICRGNVRHFRFGGSFWVWRGLAGLCLSEINVSSNFFLAGKGRKKIPAVDQGKNNYFFVMHLGLHIDIV